MTAPARCVVCDHSRATHDAVPADHEFTAGDARPPDGVTDDTRAWLLVGDQGRSRMAAQGTVADIRAALAGARPAPAEPGYDRIADAIDAVLDAADLEVAVWRSGVRIGPAVTAVRVVARALDRAGLIDWSAFADAATTEETPR